MLAVIRVLLMALFLVVVSSYMIIFSLLRPFHANNVYHGAHIMGWFARILGLKIVFKNKQVLNEVKNAVYICNHQNSYDIFTVSAAVQPYTVSIGKKSLKWIPFFGQMYWLTGNILIDRKNTNKAMNTIALTVEKIKQKGISVWLFPEGTRSNGRGLLAFKTGAFRTALQAQVPILPVCVSNLHNKVKLNRWDNGTLFIEFLAPIMLNSQDSDKVRQIANETHDMMADKFAQISADAEQLAQTKKA